MKFLNQLLLPLLVTCCLVTINGCDGKKPAGDDSHASDSDGHSEDDHADEDHPETYEEALAAVTKLTTTIGEAFDGDKADDAHGPLHHIGHALEDLGKIAKEGDMADDAKTAIAGAVKTLIESFGAVDDKMHSDDEGKDYKDVSESIGTALKTLAEYAKK